MAAIIIKLKRKLSKWVICCVSLVFMQTKGLQTKKKPTEIKK